MLSGIDGNKVPETYRFSAIQWFGAKLSQNFIS